MREFDDQILSWTREASDFVASEFGLSCGPNIAPLLWAVREYAEKNTVYVLQCGVFRGATLFGLAHIGEIAGWNLLLFGVDGKIFHQQRARPDYAHVTFHDIPQRRQFVQACFSQESAQACYAFSVREEVSFLITLLAHCPELDECEDPAVSPRPVLSEKNRSF